MPRAAPCGTARSPLNPVGRPPLPAGPPGPTLRANPFPEVTDLFCRLPLPTLFYQTRGCSPWRPDAVLGTTGRANKSLPCIFTGPQPRTGHPAAQGAFPALWPPRRVIRFRGGALLTRKENSSRGSCRRSAGSLASPHIIHRPVPES